MVAGGRNARVKERERERSKIGNYSLGPFPLYEGKALLVLLRCTVGGKVYTTPVQNHPAPVVYVDTIGVFDWVPEFSRRNKSEGE